MKITIEITEAALAAVNEALTAHRALLNEQADREEIGDDRYDAIVEVRRENQRFQRDLTYLYDVAVRQQAHVDSVVATAAAEVAPLVVEPQAFQGTVELQVFFAGRQHSWEIPADKEAFGAAKLLAEFGDTIEQVTAIKWYHTHNLPGCLPALRANSCAMNVWVTGDDGQPVVRGVDIHGRSY